MVRGAGCDSAVFPVPSAALIRCFVCSAVTLLSELIQMGNNPSKRKIFTTCCPGIVPTQLRLEREHTPTWSTTAPNSGVVVHRGRLAEATVIKLLDGLGLA